MTSLSMHNAAHSSFRPKTNNQPLKKFLSLAFDQLSKSCQKLDVTIENKVVLKVKFSKNVVNEKGAPTIRFFNKKIRKIRLIFDIENWLIKSEFCHF